MLQTDDEFMAEALEAEGAALEAEIVPEGVVYAPVVGHVHAPHAMQVMGQAPSADGLGGVQVTLIKLCTECKLAYYEELPVQYPSRIVGVNG